MELSELNCPPTFLRFFQVWARNVPRIQGLEPNLQHDLARVICGIAPLVTPTNPTLSGISADLRAVAIEISQRRTFQQSYGSDLQAALDAGGGSKLGPKKASFVPPPVYDGPGPSTTPAKPMASRSSPSLSLPRSPQAVSPLLSVPSSPRPVSPSSSMKGSSRAPSPSLYNPDSPAIEFIRETLYAALADVLERMPALRDSLEQDPPHVYFSAVAFAILDVATMAVTPEGTIVGILGRELSLSQCPNELRPLMTELVSVGRTAKQIVDEDDLTAARCLQRGEELPEPRLDRVKKMLEKGVGYDYTQDNDDPDRRRSVEGRAVVFTNRINALSLSIMQVKTFRERQSEIFKILCGSSKR